MGTITVMILTTLDMFLALRIKLGAFYSKEMNKVFCQTVQCVVSMQNSLSTVKRADTPNRINAKGMDG